MNEKKIKQTFIETIEGSYPLNLAISVLEDREKLKKEKRDLIEENNRLKKQLECLRSGEYINQLRFERDMLESIVQDGEIAKEDKDFIDCTHRNTELLEENKKLKEKLDQYERLIKDLEELDLYECELDYDYEDNSFLDYWSFNMEQYIDNWFKVEEIEKEENNG